MEDKSWGTEKQLDMPMQRNNPKKEMVRLQHGKSHQLVEEHVSGMQRDRRDFCICREKAERKKIPLE